MKELIVEHFKGKRLASWITEMINLVKIKLSDCELCEEFSSLGHLPKLRKMKLVNMPNIRIIGSPASDYGAAREGTTLYPSLTELTLWNLSQLEEWLEPGMSRDSQVFPKLEVLSIGYCPELKRMPDSCFPSLKELSISNSHKIPVSMSTKVSSLRSLVFQNMRISDTVFEGLWKNISQSLRSLKLWSCQGLTRLTVGVALEELTVWSLPNLTTISAVKDEILSLRVVNILGCPSLSVFPHNVSSTIERLHIDEMSQVTEFGICFPKLTSLQLFDFRKSTLEFDDRLVLALPAVTHLDIKYSEELKAIPDAVAKLPSLDKLFLYGCKDLESLPTFDPSHSIRCLEIQYCPILDERCKKGTGTEWYKIQHIPLVKVNGESFIPDIKISSLP